MSNFLKTRAKTLLVPAAVFALAACGDDPIAPDAGPTDDIAGIATSTTDVSTLAAALEATGLVAPLQGDGPFTVFAPVNTAFEALGEDVVTALLDDANADLLSRVLTFHVVPGTAAFAEDLTDGQTVTTLEGEQLTIGVSGSGVTVNGASVTTADIEATNGVIHLIDEVLVPSVDIVERAILTSETQTLVTAVVAGDLVGTLQGAGPFTVFAPVNSAFAALDSYTLDALLASENLEILQRVLGLHVVPGQTLLEANLTDGGTAVTVEGSELTFDLSDAADPKVNGVSITATDIEVTNGVIHLVDEVILPEFNIVETATITEGFSTLVAAVGAADLGSALSDESADLTVFAPTNAAFEALGGTVGLLLANPDILSDVLLYHVLGSAVASSSLVDGLTQATLETGDVTFTADGTSPSGFQINSANITVVDIQTSNGVIHVIDAVLTEGLNVVQRATVTPETQTLTAAVVAASTNGSEDLATLLSGTAGAPFTVFAPVQAAFEALGTDQLDVVLDPANAELLSDILRYHVVAGAKVMAADLPGLGGSATTYDGAEVTFDLSGETPMVNGVGIITTDIEVSNGVIHLIDGVLTETLDIPQVATLNGFSTLVDLVITAGLADDLSSPNGPYTVFAPTNAAFEALSAVPQGQDLIDVLTYHVLDTEVASTGLSDGLVVTNTLNGASFTVNIDGEAVSITDQAGNTVNVVATNVSAENGVIHVIDGVLLPN